MEREFLALQSFPLIKKPVLPKLRRVHLHGTIESIGHERAQDSTYWFHGLERGDKPFGVLQLTLGGRGELQYEGATYELTAGSIFVIEVPHNHVYYLPEDSAEWEFVFVCFSGSEFLRLFQSFTDLTGPLFFASEYPQVVSFFRQTFTTLTQGHDDEFVLSGLLYTLLMNTISQYYANKAQQQTHKNHYIAFTEDYCKKHLAEPFAIEQIADELGISRNHLAREFKRWNNLSISDYLESLRMEQAIPLLFSTNQPISEISVACGYTDVNYFCRVFKKNFNNSPGQYRKSRKFLYQ